MGKDPVSTVEGKSLRKDMRSNEKVPERSTGRFIKL